MESIMSTRNCEAINQSIYGKCKTEKKRNDILVFRDDRHHYNDE